MSPYTLIVFCSWNAVLRYNNHWYSWTKWHTPLIPALRRQTSKFKDSLDSIHSHTLFQTEIKQKEHQYIHLCQNVCCNFINYGESLVTKCVFAIGKLTDQLKHIHKMK